MKRELRETADGSMTIYLPEIDEHYHSYHGALQEAIHVFIKNGITCFADKFSTIQEISVFELGLGTGLNALLTALWANDNNRNVNYFGLEAFPVEADMNLQMNYHNLISNDLATVYFTKIIEDEWEKSVVISERFQIKKMEETIQNLTISDQFDIIYFDAFGPRAQEEMWNFEILQKTTSMLNPGGLFVTYCAKGQLKRDLKTLGLNVETLPGPPGKREMTIAWNI
jgi:tRNA U34 5-methylaminomethyl-2-thiouridine-forming methyltransferase MnmC